LKPSAVSPLIRDFIRLGLGVWAAYVGLFAVIGSEASLSQNAGIAMTCVGVLLLIKRLGMVVTILGTVSFALMRLDVGGWAWIWLLWPSAKLYGRRKKVFRFGFWFLIFLHLWRVQYNQNAWWAEIELWLALLSILPFVRPFSWLTLAALMLVIGSGDRDWNVPLAAMHLLTFNMNWILPPKSNDRPVIRIDSFCPLCHGLVNLLVREDRRSYFQFGAAHPHAQEMIIETATGRVRGFEAVKYILIHLGGLWYILGSSLGLLPNRLGQLGYLFLAKNRHRLFTPYKECRLRPDLGDRWVS
jgi:predicted DCC family thiol-disulfide oxidoreductase YuxK